MPVDISEYSTPKFIRADTRYPLIPDNKARFKIYSDIRSYRGEGGFPQPGYNPNHNRKTPVKVSLETLGYTVLPY